MSQPLLSICIPTYNRAGFLRECLSSLASDGVEGQFEVVVSDNASTDGTLDVLEEFRTALPLRWIIQDRNVGPDRNFDAVVAFANGEYCWILGSDDVVEPMAVPKLLEGLRTALTDIFHFGYVQTDLALKRLHSANPPAGTVGTSPDDLARYLGGMPSMSLVFTFISSFAFRRSVWMDNRGQVEGWIGTYYIQMFMMHAALARGATLAATSDCLVLARGGNPNDFNTVPGRFIALDARAVSRLVKDIYRGDRRFWRALARPFHRSYPAKALIYAAANGGIAYLTESRAALIDLGFSRWLLGLLGVLDRLNLLKVIKLALDLRRSALRQFSPKDSIA